MNDNCILSVCGIGYFGEGIYKSRSNGKMTKAYNTWNGMLERCYDSRTWIKHPNYKDCSVDERWHNFQVFAEWFENNYNPVTMKDWELDKDILLKNNKIYSPETCCLVPPELNIQFTKTFINKSGLPTGVNKHGNKFRVRISKCNIQEHIGLYNTVDDALNAYIYNKELYIKELAFKYRNKISEVVYYQLVSYKINNDYNLDSSKL